MNQILDYSPDKSNKNNNKTDKIINAFAVIIIVFAITLIISGVYGVYKRSKENKENEIVEKASIDVVQEENSLIIKVSHTKSIEKLIYTWNGGKEYTTKYSGEKEIEKEISAPAGENTLNVKVIDVDGVASSYESKFTMENGEDILKPELNIEVTASKKVKITAKDETSMAFITYRWNDDEEKRIEVSGDDETTIETEIEILKGKNDLIVSAVDASNNVTTETKNFTGLTKPEVKIVFSSDKKTMNVSVSHENGLNEITLNLNGTDYPVGIEKGIKDIEFQVALLDGENAVKITAKSIDGTETIAEESVNNTVIDENTNTITDGNTNTIAEGNTISNTVSDNSVISDDENVANVSIEKDGEFVVFTIKHDTGIKKLSLVYNGQTIDLSVLGELGANSKEVSFQIPLDSGTNKIELVVTNMEGAERKVTKEITNN